LPTTVSILCKYRNSEYPISQAMKHLFLDTSSDCGFIALANERSILGYTLLPKGNQLSKFFFSSLSSLLSLHGIPLSQIGMIGVGIGPGSFTGTRVGACIAKSLSFALNLPLADFPSLLAYPAENRDAPNPAPLAPFLYEKYLNQEFSQDPLPLLYARKID
jgi:tRNA threonylcarbamoyladenosine biosynthesis protein TsaB